MTQKHESKLVAVLVGLTVASGSCAIAYEILYMRVLTTLMGDLYYVPAAILAAFMIGIGAGAKIAHRFSRWLYVLEIATGLYAFMMPLIVGGLSDSAGMVDVSSSRSLTILVSGGLTLIPGLMIGFSIPLFSNYLKQARPDSPAFDTVFWLYHLGTVLSIMLVEFIALRALGFRATLWIAGSVNIVNGLVLWQIQRRTSFVPPPPARKFGARVLIPLAMASFVSSCFQMFFLQVCFHAFNPHRENFAIALSMSLVGIMIGTLLTARFKISFATWVAIGAVSIGLVYSFYPEIVSLYLAVDQEAAEVGATFVLVKFGFGILFALGPMICFGALIPSLMGAEQDVADESGQLLWVSSLANAVGYVFSVTVLSEALSVPLFLSLIGGTMLLAGFFSVRPTVAWMGLASLAVFSLVLLNSRWNEVAFYTPRWVPISERFLEYRTYKAGPDDATLARLPRTLKASYNGHNSVAVVLDGNINPSEMMSGVVPALAAPRLERALVLGLGTGITGGAASRIFEETDVVEINEAFYDMLPALRVANLDIDSNPNARLYLADGRSFLIGKEAEYDAIINSIPAPNYFTASKIYTHEFYERVVRALKPDGVFSTWLAVPNMTQEGVVTILTALRKHFEYCDLRIVGVDYYMTTCSRSPLEPRSLSDMPLRGRLGEELSKSLAPFTPEQALPDLRLSENIFAYYEPESQVENTDNHPVLEFMLERVRTRSGEKRLFLDNQSLMNIDPMPAEYRDDEEAFVQRAKILQVYGPSYFKEQVEPIMVEEMGLWKAFWESDRR